MSVGTGSIKRAAKTAQAGEAVDIAVEKEKKTRAKTVKEGTEAAQKIAEKKATEKKATEKRVAGRKNTGMEVSNGMYQIGQELPMYLL